MTKPLLEFHEDHVTINVYGEPEMLRLVRRDWNKIQSIQTPLIETFKNGLHIFIPWILKENDA